MYASASIAKHTELQDNKRKVNTVAIFLTVSVLFPSSNWLYHHHHRHRPYSLSFPHHGFDKHLSFVFHHYSLLQLLTSPNQLLISVALYDYYLHVLSGD